MPARRSSETTTVLEAAPSSILAFEDFVEGLAFLSPGERDRLLVAGGEMFDNVVKHGAPLRDGRIAVRARRGRVGFSGRASPIELAFFFKAQSFAAFALESESEGAKKPLFDPVHRRWRGFGLAMCRNLARRVAFRPGELMDRIFLEFEPED